MSKVKKFWNMPIHSKDIAFLNLNFPPFCAIFSDKNGGKLNFQNAIFWMDWYISKHFSPLTSLRWLLLETIIRYPIIQKQNLAGTLWRHFPAKNAKIWKSGMVISILLQNFKWIALKPVKINKGRGFWCRICPPWKVKLVLWNSKTLSESSSGIGASSQNVCLVPISSFWTIY